MEPSLFKIGKFLIWFFVSVGAEGGILFLFCLLPLERPFKWLLTFNIMYGLILIVSIRVMNIGSIIGAYADVLLFLIICFIFRNREPFKGLR